MHMYSVCIHALQKQTGIHMYGAHAVVYGELNSDGLRRDCSIHSALTLEMLHSCTYPSIQVLGKPNSRFSMLVELLYVIRHHDKLIFRYSLIIKMFYVTKLICIYSLDLWILHDIRYNGLYLHDVSRECNGLIKNIFPLDLQFHTGQFDMKCN